MVIVSVRSIVPALLTAGNAASIYYCFGSEPAAAIGRNIPCPIVVRYTQLEPITNTIGGIHEAWHRRAQALAGAHRAVLRRADDRAGHDHRERRSALDPRGPAASPKRRWSGSSTRTCSRSAASCCWAAGSAICTAIAACSCSASRCSRWRRSACGLAHSRRRAGRRARACRASAARWSRRWRCR